MIRYSLLFNLIIFSISTHAIQDSLKNDLVTFDEIKFTDAREKAAFEKVFSGEGHLLDLFFLTGNTSFEEKNLAAFKSSFEKTKQELSGVVASKKAEKQIKIIYKTVHDRFLRKYLLNTDFHMLYKDGSFNCVTATALYGLLLDDLGIPFSIKETPEHVYLIAYPDNGGVLIETTDPLKGYRVFNSDYKNLFVQSLKKNKIISENEFNSGDIDDLFDQYFFPPNAIGLKELAGIHYTNNAIALFEKEEYSSAFEQLKKAYLLYPCEKNAFLLLQAGSVLVDKADYKNEEDLGYLVFISKFAGTDIEKDVFKGLFIKITYNLLINDYQPEKYDTIYYQLTSGIENEEVLSDVDYVYHYERGRVLLNKGQYKKAFPFVEKSYGLNPKNSDAQQNFIVALAHLVDYEFATADIFEKIDKASKQHPEILENNNFLRLKGFAYLKGIEEAYKAGEEASGTERMRIFETFLSEHTSLKFDENQVGRAYSEAAVYYFKKGQDAKSLRIINRGLVFAPESKELKMRQAMLR